MNAGQGYIICAEMKHSPYNLKGTSLEVFAALYALTKKRAYLGSYQDLANWIEIDNMTLMRAIKKMQERGLVTVEDAKDSLGRYKLQTHQIEGYPLPDYKYCENTSSQNEVIASQNEIATSQNEPISKEKNQKKIYTKSSFYTKEEVIKRDKPTAATAFNDNLVEIVPYPQSFQEVWEYAQEKQPGISAEVARDFFAYYSARGWKYKNNGIIYNWQAELFNWNQRIKRWEKEKAARAFPRYQLGGRQEEPSLAQLMAEEAIRRQKEADRQRAEEHDKEASTPEALAARDRFFAKFCPEEKSMCS